MRLRYLAVEEKDAVKTEKNELEQLKNELNQCVSITFVVGHSNV